VGVSIRNELFELGILKSKKYDFPVISVGNITVGGTGKTPHTEYLIRLLKDQCRVAVLSRGYKRQSKGYVLATSSTPMPMIGDEPFQMKEKFPDIHVAVDKNRRHGIEQLKGNKETSDTDVILLDDAFQHRYVEPGLNILLVDYHRMIYEDALLPAGRLRESPNGKRRAHIVIVTKCPKNISPIGFRVIRKSLALYPYQKLFFTRFRYGCLKPMYGKETLTLESLQPHTNVLLLTGIASPEQMEMDLKEAGVNVKALAFSDHHYFSEKDVASIEQTFAALPSPKLIVTTEKDATRLRQLSFNNDVQEALFVLPVEVEFLQNQQKEFNKKIWDYVHEDSRNIRMAKK
jgi:tetraacyldisaccharide 4'-kinase